ncbi:phosphoribosylformylglycinamidine synthase subunit PurL, partial [Candidatus Bathyarchaeota archaeon]
LYIIGVTKPELGGSEYYRLMGFLGASVPRLRPKETIKAYRRLLEAMDRGLVKACHDLSEGGLAVAAAEMAFTGWLGLEIDVDAVPAEGVMRPDQLLFSESNGRLLVEVVEGRESEFEDLMADSPNAKIGRVIDEENLIILSGGEALMNLSLKELIEAWKTPLGA